MLTKTEKKYIRDFFKALKDEFFKRVADMLGPWMADFIEDEMRIELRTLIVAHLKDKS